MTVKITVANTESTTGNPVVVRVCNEHGTVYDSVVHPGETTSAQVSEGEGVTVIVTEGAALTSAVDNAVKSRATE